MASEFSKQLQASQNQTGGSSLPPALQAKAAQKLNADFSGVRVHTDASKYQAGANMGAQAYTTGRQIAFQQAKYQPGGNTGQQLLGHELTHVVQQTQAR